MKQLMKQKKYLLLLCVLLMGTLLTACGQSSSDTPPSDSPTTGESMNQNPTVTISIENYGDVVVELYPDKAPNTVNNFLTLADSGFYDNLIFHRIIEGFMIQGGDPDGVGTGGPGYSIPGEFASNGFENNDIPHVKGVISMARSFEPDSAGSQFFIMSADSPHLDGEYAGFGAVISGLEFIEQIEKVATASGDRPVEDVVITKMTVDTQGQSIPDVIKVEQ